MKSYNSPYSDLLCLVIEKPSRISFTISSFLPSKERNIIYIRCHTSLSEYVYLSGTYSAYVSYLVGDRLLVDAFFATLVSVSVYISDDDGKYKYDCRFSVEM